MAITYSCDVNASWTFSQPFSLIVFCLYEAIQDESAKLCFIFHSVQGVLYFPLENIVPEIVLHIRCNKPVKVLRHYGKILHACVVSRLIQHSALPRTILASQPYRCALSSNALAAQYITGWSHTCSVYIPAVQTQYQCDKWKWISDITNPGIEN